MALLLLRNGQFSLCETRSLSRSARLSPGYHQRELLSGLALVLPASRAWLSGAPLKQHPLSSLPWQVVKKEGTGTECPMIGDKVTVHYTGWLLDGSKFDSSRDRKDKFSFDFGKGDVSSGSSEVDNVSLPSIFYLFVAHIHICIHTYTYLYM